MHGLIRHSLILIGMAALGQAACLAEEGGITRQLHPWGRFQPGAWKVVRAVTETFDDQGSLTSTTETRTSLREVSQDSVTLQVDILIRVGGKQFDSEPQVVKQGFHGELSDQSMTVRQLGPGEVVIQGRKIPCKVQQVDVAGPTSKTTTKVFYSDKVEPYILRRESVRTDPEGKTVLSESTVEVIALDVPCQVLRGVFSASHVKSVTKHAKGTSTTLSVMSMDIPGGVICQTSKETDVHGQLVRRSSLELVDYGLEPETIRPGYFFRKFFRQRIPFRLTPAR